MLGSCVASSGYCIDVAFLLQAVIAILISSECSSCISLAIVLQN